MAFKLVTSGNLKKSWQREFEKLEKKEKTFDPLNGTDRLLHRLKIY